MQPCIQSYLAMTDERKGGVRLSGPNFDDAVSREYQDSRPVQSLFPLNRHALLSGKHTKTHIVERVRKYHSQLVHRCTRQEGFIVLNRGQNPSFIPQVFLPFSSFSILASHFLQTHAFTNICTVAILSLSLDKENESDVRERCMGNL